MKESTESTELLELKYESIRPTRLIQTYTRGVYTLDYDSPESYEMSHFYVVYDTPYSDGDVIGFKVVQINGKFMLDYSKAITIKKKVLDYRVANVETTKV